MVTIGGRAHTLEQIEEVGKLGYPYAEIDVSDPDVIDQQFDDLLRLKEKYNLFYLAHYPNEGNPTDVEMLAQQFVPKMKSLFTCTRKLGIEKGTMHFWMDQRRAPPELVEGKIKLLSELADDATQKGVVLCLENLTSQHHSFATVFGAIPDLRMTMDIGHGELLSDENTAFGFIEHLLDRIAHVHVHDNRGGTTVKDDLHLPLGDGIVDYPRILTLLKEKGYASTLTMEVLPVAMIRTQAEVERYIR
ncbi:MAG: sugar phosphate isomerase/epimerase [Desulfobacterales bacterium]